METAENASYKAQSAKERFTAVMAESLDMQRVEELLASKLSSDAALLEQIPSYLLGLGGKRMRPLLCLLVAQMLNTKQAPQALIDVAAGIELIHMATLLHDDIIDRSPLRRHRESPFVRFGLGNTLLAGDFLLVRAFSLCARLDRHIIDATEEACIELTEGEILETPLYLEEHSLDSSLNIARKKTASLFRLAAECGAYIATQEYSSPIHESVTRHMRQFGADLGLAFQILDDILDVTSREDLLGKKSGIDIQERKPSVVNVLWLAGGSELAQKLRERPIYHSEECAQAPDLGVQYGDPDYLSEAIAEIRASEAILKARDLAKMYSDKALESLHSACAEAPSVAPQYRLAVEAIIEYTIQRLE